MTSAFTISTGRNFVSRLNFESLFFLSRDSAVCSLIHPILNLILVSIQADAANSFVRTSDGDEMYLEKNEPIEGSFATP